MLSADDLQLRKECEGEQGVAKGVLTSEELLGSAHKGRRAPQGGDLWGQNALLVHEHAGAGKLRLQLCQTREEVCVLAEVLDLARLVEHLRHLVHGSARTSTHSSGVDGQDAGKKIEFLSNAIISVSMQGTLLQE